MISSPPTEKWSGLTPAPWLPQETNCDQTFGPVLQRHPENPVRRLEQRRRRWWCFWHHWSGNYITPNRCLFLYSYRYIRVKTVSVEPFKQPMSFSFLFFFYSGPPIVSEEELASLALISPEKTSQYSGSRVKALIQILQHQLDQQELVKEFMVCLCFKIRIYQYNQNNSSLWNCLSKDQLIFVKVYILGTGLGSNVVLFLLPLTSKVRNYNYQTVIKLQ